MIIIKAGPNRFNFSHYKSLVVRQNGVNSSIHVNPTLASSLSTQIIQGTEEEVERMMDAFDQALIEKRTFIDLDVARDTPVTAAVVEEQPAEFFDTAATQPKTKGRRSTTSRRSRKNVEEK